MPLVAEAFLPIVNVPTGQGDVKSPVVVMQLGLTALRKGERTSGSFQRFIKDALEYVPDLKEEIYSCAVEAHFVQNPGKPYLLVDQSW